MSGADWSRVDEEGSFLWSSLEALRGHISAETFEQAERELGFAPDPRQFQRGQPSPVNDGILKGNDHGIHRN